MDDKKNGWFLYLSYRKKECMLSEWMDIHLSERKTKGI